MKYLKYFIIISMLLVILIGCGSEKTNRNDQNGENDEVSSKQNEINNETYLFNSDEMETIEISGKDLLKRKETKISAEIILGKKIDLVIRRDNTGPGFSMIIYLGNRGVDMVSYLEESVDEWCGPKQDFYYQMALYDYEHDGKKEIIIVGGNKKDIFELYVFRLNLDFSIGNDLQLLAEVNGSYKSSYVNEEDKICVIEPD